MSDDYAEELARISVRLKDRKARASVLWEHQQTAKRLVASGKITQEQCDRIIELSGGEYRRVPFP